jgi:hypothetical protein
MRQCKLRSGVNWPAALKQKGVKQTGIKQGLGLLICSAKAVKCAAQFTNTEDAVTEERGRQEYKLLT